MQHIVFTHIVIFHSNSLAEQEEKGPVEMGLTNRKWQDYNTCN